MFTEVSYIVDGREVTDPKEVLSLSVNSILIEQSLILDHIQSLQDQKDACIRMGRSVEWADKRIDAEYKALEKTQERLKQASQERDKAVSRRVISQEEADARQKAFKKYVNDRRKAPSVDPYWMKATSRELPAALQASINALIPFKPQEKGEVAYIMQDYNGKTVEGSFRMTPKVRTKHVTKKTQKVMTRQDDDVREPMLIKEQAVRAVFRIWDQIFFYAVDLSKPTTCYNLEFQGHVNDFAAQAAKTKKWLDKWG